MLYSESTSLQNQRRKKEILIILDKMILLLNFEKGKGK